MGWRAETDFINFNSRGYSVVKSLNRSVGNEECNYTKSQEITVETSVVDFKSSQREFEIAWNHIEIVWKWYKSYEVYWNHLKLCTIDDFIKFWNNWNHSGKIRYSLKSFVHSESEWPLALIIFFSKLLFHNGKDEEPRKNALNYFKFWDNYQQLSQYSMNFEKLFKDTYITIQKFDSIRISVPRDVTIEKS